MSTAWLISISHTQNDELGAAAVDVHEEAREACVGVLVALAAGGHHVLLGHGALGVRLRQDLVVPMAVRAHGAREVAEEHRLAVVGVHVGLFLLAVAAAAHIGDGLPELLGLGIDDPVRAVAVAAGRGLVRAFAHDEVPVEGLVVHLELGGVAVAAGGELGLLVPALGLLGGVLARLEARVAGGAIHARVHGVVPGVLVDGERLLLSVDRDGAETRLAVALEAGVGLAGGDGERDGERGRRDGQHEAGRGQREEDDAAQAHCGTTSTVTPSAAWQSMHICVGWQTRQDRMPLAATGACAVFQSAGWSTV